MSQKNDDQALLDRLAREGGRITFDRLTCRGLNADRLIKNDRAYTGKHTGNRWELVLAPYSGDSPGVRS